MKTLDDLPKVIHAENGGEGAHQNLLMPEPLPVTPREFNSGQKVPEAVVKEEWEWFVGTGRAEEGQCWMERGGWGLGEQQGHRDETSDARTVLLCPDRA